jgi:cystathionine beta-lyase
MEFPDLPALVDVCRSGQVLTALDNTWGSGVAFDPFSLGIDVSVHALTKYPSGGGDVLMGSVITRDEALHLRIKGTHMRLGMGVAANDVEAILRALPSVELRYRAHDRSARELARWLGTRAEVAQVLHPALEGAPGHAHWKALCGQSDAAAGLFSVVFKLGYSWGGPISLVVPYDMPSMRRAWSHPGILVRFSIGLEAASDLRADLEQALSRMAR